MEKVAVKYLEDNRDDADQDAIVNGASLISIAISLKRIADAMDAESPFLKTLFGTLEDASHNHQQRMRNV